MKISLLIILFVLCGIVHCNTALGQPIFNGANITNILNSSGYLQLSYMNKLKSNEKNPYTPMFFLAKDKQTYYFGIQIKQMNTYPPVDTTSCAIAFFMDADGQEVALRRKSGKSALYAKEDRSWGWRFAPQATPYFDCYIFFFYVIDDYDTFANTIYKGYSLLDGMIQFNFNDSASKRFKKALLREKEVIDKWYNNPSQINENVPIFLDLNHDYEHPALDNESESILNQFRDSL